MERFIQLNLTSDSEKVVPASLPTMDRKDPEPNPSSKRLHRLLNKAAHKPAASLNSNRSGIFSK